jgi:hypothetical protein
MIKVDDKDPTTLALRAGEMTLQELSGDSAEKEKDLAAATQRYMARRNLGARSSLEVEAEARLGIKQAHPQITAEDLENIEHEISVLEIAIERQRQIVNGLRGRFSLKICAANRDRYVAIEKRIARAVVDLASANEAEILFFNELQDAGCSTIVFRPMRIDQVGLISDPNSRASHHRREVNEFCPEAAAT